MGHTYVFTLLATLAPRHNSTACGRGQHMRCCLKQLQCLCNRPYTRYSIPTHPRMHAFQAPSHCCNPRLEGNQAATLAPKHTTQGVGEGGNHACTSVWSCVINCTPCPVTDKSHNGPTQCARMLPSSCHHCPTQRPIKPQASAAAPALALQADEARAHPPLPPSPQQPQPPAASAAQCTGC